jgi:hypothetical protein
MPDFYVHHLSPIEPTPGPSASVEAPPASSSAPSEQEALDAYLFPSSPGDPTSFLEAALNDATAARTADPPALWLATLCYLVVIEQIGNTVQSRSSPIRRRDVKDREAFTATAREFGDAQLSDPEREVLYDIRCALAHNFGLTSAGKRFIYDVVGPLMSSVTNNPIRVNLIEIGNYVERLVSKLRDENIEGAVRIRYDVKYESVIAMRFQVVH